MENKESYDIVSDLKKFRMIFEDIDEGIYIVDKERKILCWNDSAKSLTGYDKSEMIGKHCYDNILNHIDEKGRHLCFEYCPLVRAMKDRTKKEDSVFLHHKDGHRVPVRVKAIPLFDGSGESVGAIEIFTDTVGSISEKIKELEKLALIDPLTQIANRRYLISSINSKISEFERENITFSLIFIDIDDFKKINDVYGHDMGDEILRMVSSTIKSNIRAEDMIGRWGGEEFVVLLPNCSHHKLEKVAEKIRVLVENSSKKTADGEISVTVSIGGTVCVQNDSVQSIVKRADELMYHVKKNGKNAVKIDYN